MFTLRIRNLTSAVPIALLIACGGGATDSSEVTTFDHYTLQGGPTVPQGEYVIRTRSELAPLLQYFLDPLPTVSYPNEMVVGLSRGPSRVCTSLNIEKVQYTSVQVTVQYKMKFTFTGSSCFSPSPIQSGTTGDFVVVPFSSLPVVFIESAA